MTHAMLNTLLNELENIDDPVMFIETLNMDGHPIEWYLERIRNMAEEIRSEEG